jgi:nucleotide-binding universal stress UspA family protein
MTFRSILVHAEADPRSEPRLRLATDLANRFDAGLIGVAAETYEPQSFMGGYANVDGELLMAESEAVQDDLKIAEARFTEAAKTVKAGAQWRAASAVPEEFVAEECRAADLLVVGPRQREPYGFKNRLDPGDILMRAGRPILIAPLDLAQLDASSIVVAWKDTREARRAVRDALPFLKAASQVLVAAVTEHKDEESAKAGVADVAEFLARHGVKASTAVRAPNAISAADTLIEIADMQEAGLIVAGGFGHSRFREWVFGGVTQELLWYGAKPVLLSH